MSATRVYKLTTTRVTKVLTDAGFTQSHTYGQRIKQMSAGFIVRPGVAASSSPIARRLRPCSAATPSPSTEPVT